MPPSIALPNCWGWCCSCSFVWEFKENNFSGFVLPPIKHHLLGKSSTDQSRYYGLETRASFQMPGAPNCAICQNTLEGGRKYWSGEVGRTYFTTVNFCHLPPATCQQFQSTLHFSPWSRAARKLYIWEAPTHLWPCSRIAGRWKLGSSSQTCHSEIHLTSTSGLVQWNEMTERFHIQFCSARQILWGYF